MLLCIMFALFMVENLGNAHNSSPASFQSNFSALGDIEGGSQTPRLNIVYFQMSSSVSPLHFLSVIWSCLCKS